ncbi:hypothetical protein DUI87_16783 [Hirundo rustica rustica]|uniref:Uncharacterized protein n=1 Tax=Hirundo rustica rustica TaxID=333673 RepID=A0A3M0K7M2_HIRRU|nr:hypothetical protein DUI87_16783 [Hirundo rustica rustica]
MYLSRLVKSGLFACLCGIHPGANRMTLPNVLGGRSKLGDPEMGKVNIRDENHGDEITLLVLVPAAEDLDDFAGQNVKNLLCEYYGSFGISQATLFRNGQFRLITDLEEKALEDNGGMQM